MNWIRNLREIETHAGNPWDFTVTTPLPKAIRKDKAARDSWINDPETEHNVYSLTEGLNDSLRVSKETPDETGNPPFKLYGIVADFDEPLTEDEIVAGVGRIEFAPAYCERSLSGNVHLIWLFSEPVLVNGYSVCREFLKFAHDRMRLSSIGPGLDLPAYSDPARRYINSGEWTKLSDNTLDAAMVRGWMMRSWRTSKFW